MIFTFHYWKEDEVLAPILFQELRSFHPKEEVVIFRDGPGSNKVYKFFENQPNTSIIPHSAFKREQLIRYIVFWFQFLLDFDSQYFVFLDPDSKVLRPIEPPKDSLWGGSTFNNLGICSTIGAGFYLHRDLLEQAIENKDKIEKEITYVRGTEVIPSFDSTLGNFLNSLGYKPKEWNEVETARQWSYGLEKSSKAIIHPRFEKITPL